MFHLALLVSIIKYTWAIKNVSNQIFQRNWNQDLKEMLSTSMFTAAFLTIARRRKWPKYYQWMKEENVETYKHKEILSYTSNMDMDTSWGHYAKCETSQSQKDKYRVVPSHEVSKLASLRKRKVECAYQELGWGRNGDLLSGLRNSALQDENCIQYTFFLIRRYIFYVICSSLQFLKEFMGLFFKSQKSLVEFI